MNRVLENVLGAVVTVALIMVPIVAMAVFFYGLASLTFPSKCGL